MRKALLILAAVAALVSLTNPADSQQTSFDSYTLSGAGGGFNSSPPATLGTCTTSHSLTAANDLLTCGKGEVDGLFYTDGGIYNSSQAIFNGAFSAYPSVAAYFFNSGGGATHWISLSHNQTDGVISTGLGNLTIGSGADSHNLTTPNDLMVSGKLEVNGLSYFDERIFATGIIYSSNASEVTYGGMGWIADDGWRLLVGADDNFANNNIVISTIATRSDSYLHNTLSANPTIFLHSATAPGTATNQWLSLTHNQTDGVITTGTGQINLGSSTRVGGNLTIGIGTTSYPAIRSSVPTATNANIHPSADDTDTGIGGLTGDTLSLIAGGVEMVHLMEGTTDYAKTQVAQAYSKDTPTCSDATDTCSYSGEVTISLYTSGTDVTQDTITVTSGAAGGLTRTFIKRAGTDSILVDVSTGTDYTLDENGDSVTYIYDDVSVSWWIVSTYEVP